MADNTLNPNNKKYYVEVTQHDSTRIFENCTYSYFHSQNQLHITTSDGMRIKFIGNFSAEIISMKDYTKTLNVHD